MVLLTQSLNLHEELCLVELRHLRTEHLCQIVRLILCQICLLGIFLHDESVDDIRIHTGEAAFLQLLLQHIYHRCIELTFHQEHRVTLLLGSLDVRVLLLLIVSIEIYQIAILISLVVLDQRLVLLVSEVLALHILQKREILGALVEVFL